MRADSHAEFAQWFYFRVSGARGERLVMTFENAADCAFAEGWRDYQAVASYDRVNWFRVPTSYDGRVMTIDHTPDFDRIYYAYFEPYSEERHSEFLGAVQQMPHAALTEIGQTVQGRPMSLLTLGVPGARRRCRRRRTSGSSRASIRARRWRNGSSKGWSSASRAGATGRAIRSRASSSITPCSTSCRT